MVVKILIQENYVVLEERFPHITSKLNNAKDLADVDDLNHFESFDRDEIWLQAIDLLIGNARIVFVYGFGMGLGIADLLERYPDRWFFVYEPNEMTFLELMEKYDFSELINHPHLYYLAVGKSQLTGLYEMLCAYMQEQLVFVAQRVYLERKMEMLHDLKNDFAKYYKETYRQNKYTENRFRTEWTRNYLYHLPDVLATPSIEQLAQKLKGCTALIVSSGPSLNEDIEWIRQLKPHVLVISAGSSIQALIKHGIHPHLCVIMDGHPVNDKIFISEETLEAPLLFTSSSYYEVSDRKADGKIHSIMKSDQVTQYLFGLTENQLLMYPTPTVAGTAIQAAVYLGAKKILLAGQDLSYPGNQVYTNGISHFSEEDVAVTAKKAKREVLNVKGSYNTTDESFLVMKSSLEELINSLPHIEFINTTRNGAVIEGAGFQPLDELYDTLTSNTVKSDIIDSLIDLYFQPPKLEQVEFLRSKVHYLIEDLLKMSEEIRRSLRITQILPRTCREKPGKGIKLYTEVETLWEGIANREWFSPLVESLMPLELAKFDNELPNIFHEQRLIQKSDLLAKHLGELLDKLNSQLPELDDMLQETLSRVDRLKKSIE